MKTVFLMAALLMGVAARPAFAQIVWQEGEATLSTGIIVRGEICFQPDANALLIRRGDQWRTYPASQLQDFHFVDAKGYHLFTVYAVPQKGSEETVPLLFEEITIDATVRILQLPGRQAWQASRKLSLPPSCKGQWATLLPWYVWIDGRFVAPDVFVQTELSDLLASSPDAVQRWASTRPRPHNPKALSRWLACYYGHMELAKKMTTPTVVSWRK